MEGAVGGVAEFPNQRRGAQPLHGGPFFHQARNQQQQKNEGRRPAEQRKKVIAYPFVPSLFKGGGVYVLLPDSFQAGHGVCVAALADFFLGDAHLGGRVMGAAARHLPPMGVGVLVAALFLQNSGIHHGGAEGRRLQDGDGVLVAVADVEQAVRQLHGAGGVEAALLGGVGAEGEQQITLLRVGVDFPLLGVQQEDNPPLVQGQIREIGLIFVKFRVSQLLWEKQNVVSLVVQLGDRGVFRVFGYGEEKAVAVDGHRVVFGGHVFFQLGQLLLGGEFPPNQFEKVRRHRRRAQEGGESAGFVQLDEALVDPLGHHIHAARRVGGQLERLIGVILAQRGDGGTAQLPAQGEGGAVEEKDPGVSGVGHIEVVSPDIDAGGVVESVLPAAVVERSENHRGVPGGVGQD